MKGHPLIVVGAGGHARVLLDALGILSVKVLGVTDKFPGKVDRSKLKVKLLGTDEAVLKYDPKKVRLVNGLGSTGNTEKRMKLFNYFKSKGYQFANVIHPSAVVAGDVELSEGVQIMAGAVVQTGCRIGRNVVINTHASIDHDCTIEDHVFIAPGVVLSGSVVVCEERHLGTASGAIQGRRIGKRKFIGAGYMVLEDVADDVEKRVGPEK